MSWEVTWRDERGEPSTKTVELALSVPNCAVIVADPADSPVTEPGPPTIATFVPEMSDADHETNSFNICELPSLQVPVAVYCWLAPGANSVLLGVTERD